MINHEDEKWDSVYVFFFSKKINRMIEEKNDSWKWESFSERLIMIVFDRIIGEKIKEYVTSSLKLNISCSENDTYSKVFIILQKKIKLNILTMIEVLCRLIRFSFVSATDISISPNRGNEWLIVRYLISWDRRLYIIVTCPINMILMIRGCSQSRVMETYSVIDTTR